MHLSLKWAVLDHIRNCNNFNSFKQIHAHVLTTALFHDHLVSNAVVEYFGKYIAVLDYACDYLKHLDWRSSSFPFNSLVSRYSAGNVPGAGFLVYRKIVGDGFVPDTFTFPPVVKSCAKLLGVKEGTQLHGVIVRMGFSSHVYVQNSLVHFYGACGDCGTARDLFDEMPVRDVISWSCLISGYAKTDLFGEALEAFSSMDVEPNTACFVIALAGCGRRGHSSLGKCIHGAVSKRPVGGEQTHPPILGNALMDMYVKCENLFDARRVFDEMPEKDVISWNCMISGLVQSQRPEESLEFFDRMQRSDEIEPDGAVLTSVLSACASLGALDRGKWVHEYVDRQKGIIERDVQIGTAMVDMYAKCGSINAASRVFDEMPSRNVVAWNALLAGLALHGRGREAIGRFEEMRRSGARPNGITFLAVLTACCHSGLVEEGRGYFRQMVEKPRLEHYGCMVDMLCRAGLVEEARSLVAEMPMDADVSIWGAILSASNETGNVELSREASDRVVEIESRDSGSFVVLSNVYAASERWDDVARLRSLMKEKGIRKAPGSSLVEVDGKTHEFLVGDLSHPCGEEIYELLSFLAHQVSLEVNISSPILI